MIPITRYDSKTFCFIFVFYSHYTLNSQQLHSTLRLDIYQCSVDRSIQFKTWSFVPKLTLIIKKSKKNSVKLVLLGNTENWCSPTLIREEMNYNVFMRSTFDERLLKLTGINDVIDCMRFLREWKNAGNKPAL